MKNLAKVPIGTAYKPRQNHITAEGAMIQSVYLSSQLSEKKRELKTCIFICAAISLLIICTISQIVSLR